MASLDTTTGLLGLLGDPTRVRLLALLAEEQFTVAELVAITDLGQSRVSTHLGRLRDAGLLRDRRVGNSTYYGLNDAMPTPAQKLWDALRQQLNDGVLDTDRKRAHQLRLAQDRAESCSDS
jgi:DNA-binding transcriptional ArsR family regulator